MFYVYILCSEKHARTYSGQTENIALRLTKHNAGLVKSTKAYRPWILIHQEEFETRSEAMEREKWLKSPGGRRFIAEIMKKRSKGLPRTD